MNPFVMLRRARMRGLKEGKVQRARIEATENDAKDDAERHQDYGFASNPVDGEGLVLHIGGHTIILRKDRLAERPQLAGYEVAIWHKEGHHVTLRDGKLVECECNHFVLKAKEDVTIETKTVTIKASTKVYNQTPLHQVTGIAQPQNLTIGGISGGGDAIMNGGTWSMQDVQWTAVGGSFTYNGKDMTDSHRHKNVQSGNGTSGSVS